MPYFGRESKRQLSTCHDDLQLIMNEGIKFYDFSILEGIRTAERQKMLFRQGLTKCNGVSKKSKHQAGSGISMAVDIVPYPVDWNKHSRFFYLAGILFAVERYLFKAKDIKHRLRWGGDFNSNKNFEDQSWYDYPHYELVKPEDIGGRTWI